MSDADTLDCTPAELVVLVYHLTGGAVPLDEQAEALFAAEGLDAAAIEERLEDRGLLLRLPYEESIGVVGEAAALLRAALDPERLLHLRVREGEREALRTFSLAEGAWVRHELAAGGGQRFAFVGDDGALLAALAATAAAEGRRTAMLLMVESPGEPDAPSAALGWVEGDGQVALLSPDEGEPHLVTLDAFRAALRRFLAGAPTPG